MTEPKTKKLELVNAYGGDFLIPLGYSCIGYALKSSGQFETDDINRVASFLDSVQKEPSKKNLFVDIGANIGTHSISALKDHGYRKVYAVEPSASNYRLLTANICLNGLLGQAVCINAAASDHEGTSTLVHSLANCGDYRLSSNTEVSRIDDDSTTEQISTINIANHLSDQLQYTELGDVLCWIDTQGHEITILKTLRPLLERGLPVVFEFWPYGMEQQEGSFTELEAALKLADLQIAHLNKNSIELISLEDLGELWKQLRSRDSEKPEGASFSNIIIYKCEARDIITSAEYARIDMTIRCKDSSLIPKVERAGEVFLDQDFTYQLMHNGLKVVSGGYYGEWMRELIEKLKGHHEPQ